MEIKTTEEFDRWVCGETQEAAAPRLCRVGRELIDSRIGKISKPAGVFTDFVVIICHKMDI